MSKIYTNINKKGTGNISGPFSNRLLKENII